MKLFTGFLMMVAVLGLCLGVSAFAVETDEPGMDSTTVVEGASQTIGNLIGGIANASMGWSEFPKNALAPAGPEVGAGKAVDQTCKGVMQIATFPVMEAEPTGDGTVSSNIANPPQFSMMREEFVER